LPIRALVATIALVAIPVAVTVERPPGPSKNRAEEKTCEVNRAIGSRLERVRLCTSRRERDEYRKELATDNLRLRH